MKNALASSENLLDAFKSRLKTAVAIDDAVSDSTVLKVASTEFQLANTAPGPFLHHSTFDAIRDSMEQINDIEDAIIERSHKLDSQYPNLNLLKSAVMADATNNQSKTELNTLMNQYGQSENAVRTIIDEKMDPFLDQMVNPPTSVYQISNAKSNGSNGYDGNHSKRRRKPTARAEEMVDVDDMSEIFSDNEGSQSHNGNGNGFGHFDPSTNGIDEDDDNYLGRTKKRKTANGPILSNIDNDSLSSIAPSLQSKLTAKEIKSLERLYDTTFVSIWKDMARKDGPKAYRLFQQTSQAKSINLRKTAQLASRESIRWQVRTTKTQKDQITKARRCMREMLNYWKKNEREERNQRQKAEQSAQAKAKKFEEERESKRQAKKLNFLLNQTELYSHFIGKKIKTDELEGDMGDKSGLTTQNGTPAPQQPNEDEVDITKVTKDIQDVDFDDKDDEELKKMAAANAHSALMEVKARAQAFNTTDIDGEKLDGEDEDNEGEMNFQNPTSLGDIKLEQPSLLNCTLKEYQLKGLNWLANLYDQGINGILADEMGLGKTVQSISVLAYLAETHGIWGPFLVVTPASTLHNWQQEISKFVPDFKVIPYWGSSKDRKVLRKFWDKKNVTYNRGSPFHVIVTSYQLVVQDASYFQKMKWQYMILDEAQAIKSSQSSRWKILLSFQCRNRLLLTGTPIQNNMQELWALLHFIMPSLFDNHDEFSEWFAKDIEAHAEKNAKLNEQQLRRLHAILKPFMLRRIKKNVQSELGDKIEIDVYCDLTNRQKKLYRMLRSQINVVDLIENNKRIGRDEEVESIMNVVMQFRKVCNHPDLFERADTKSAFVFGDYAKIPGLEGQLNLGRDANDIQSYINYSTKNLIDYDLPKLLYEDLMVPNWENDNGLTQKDLLIKKMFNIWDPSNWDGQDKKEVNKAMGVLKFVDKTSNEIQRISESNLLQRAIEKRSYVSSFDDRVKLQEEVYGCNFKKNSVVLSEKSIPETMVEVKDEVSKSMYMQTFVPGSFELALAPPININCSNTNFNGIKNRILFDGEIRQALTPLSLNTQGTLIDDGVPLDQWPKAEMMPEEESKYMGGSTIRLPSMERFVLESAKLKQLDRMLVELKKGGHKCLIYFQMTKMMDLMEEYLTYRQYNYIRLDGSSKLSDRRDLVNDWQTDPDLFIFILSTRAGGLGINLTAADTVIFYDSDWNPTIDSQAMDRAHRLGQTRQVTVYRLLVKGTIEERMRDRAKQKEHVQQVVMEGKVDPAYDQQEDKKDPGKEMAMLLLADE